MEKLDVEKFKTVHTDLNNLKSGIDKLDANKLKTVFVNLWNHNKNNFKDSWF